MSLEVRPTWNPLELPPAPVRRFTVEEYHRMIEAGILGPNDRVELLEGWIVEMSPQNPPHRLSVTLASDALRKILPPGWEVDTELPVTLEDSEPEPDVSVVQGPRRRYTERKPGPADIALLVEVADTTLLDDRRIKCPLYARAQIAMYWIINLPESKIEVYSQASAVHGSWRYDRRDDYSIADAVPVVIEGREVGRISVRELLP